MYYLALSKEGQDWLKQVLREITKEGKIKAIFLNLHSRFDICDVCGATLVKWRDMFEERLNEMILEIGGEEFKQNRIPFYVMASFREYRKGKSSKERYDQNSFTNTESLNFERLDSFVEDKVFPVWQVPENLIH
jgi:hypothetical protein